MIDRINFPVEKVQLQTTNGIVIPGKVAIQRTDTGDILGISSKGYSLVKHEDVIGSVNEALKDEMELDNITVCRKGAIMFAQYKFKNIIKPETVKKGDIVDFGLEVFNSYDGTMEVGFALTALRLVCTNGMIIPKSIARLAVKHTRRADITGIRDKVLERLPRFREATSVWRRWSSTGITNDIAVKFISDLFGKRNSKVIEEIYKVEREKDQTVWGLFNALTKYNTHHIKMRKNTQENKRIRQWAFENTIVNRFYKVFASK